MKKFLNTAVIVSLSALALSACGTKGESSTAFDRPSQPPAAEGTVAERPADESSSTLDDEIALLPGRVSVANTATPVADSATVPAETAPTVSDPTGAAPTETAPTETASTETAPAVSEPAPTSSDPAPAVSEPAPAAPTPDPAATGSSTGGSSGPVISVPDVLAPLDPVVLLDPIPFVPVLAAPTVGNIKVTCSFATSTLTVTADVRALPSVASVTVIRRSFVGATNSVNMNSVGGGVYSATMGGDTNFVPQWIDEVEVVVVDSLGRTVRGTASFSFAAC